MPAQVLLTWECTIAHAIPWDTFFPWIKKDTDKARFVAAISKASIEHEYKLNRTGWIACDPLAVAVAIRPELIEEAQVQSFAFLCATQPHYSFACATAGAAIQPRLRVALCLHA